jgi:hypothetical protein
MYSYSDREYSAPLNGKDGLRTAGGSMTMAVTVGAALLLTVVVPNRLTPEKRDTPASISPRGLENGTLTRRNCCRPNAPATNPKGMSG